MQTLKYIKQKTNAQILLPQHKNAKTHKIAAWLVSNCNTHSEREDYVTDLQEHISIDIYGQCGNHRCPDNDRCFEFLSKKYMFYLSFENSICQDYVTEIFLHH